VPSIKVNGRIYEVEIDPKTPLLWYLRDHLGLMGSSTAAVSPNAGLYRPRVRPGIFIVCDPVEGIWNGCHHYRGLGGKYGHALFEAWTTEDAACGYCQPGQIMTAAAFLSRNPKPAVPRSTTPCRVLCRCRTYQAVRIAIHRAAGSVNHEGRTTSGHEPQTISENRSFLRCRVDHGSLSGDRAKDKNRWQKCGGSTGSVEAQCLGRIGQDESVIEVNRTEMGRGSLPWR
jgi:isoquinoline 1-oxidoreductase alpha subunit